MKYVVRVGAVVLAADSVDELAQLVRAHVYGGVE